MGTDLHNFSGGYFGCGASSWRVYRLVAEAFGWEPSGPSWNKDELLQYSDVDAKALGDALERALASEGFESVLRHARGGFSPDAEDGDGGWQAIVNFDREHIVGLREFCRGGGFTES